MVHQQRSMKLEVILAEIGRKMLDLMIADEHETFTQK